MGSETQLSTQMPSESSSVVSMLQTESETLLEDTCPSKNQRKGLLSRLFTSMGL